MADAVRAHPERWIAQEVVKLSTVPTAGHDGRARAAPRRPAPVRGLRRADQHRPRRPDARRARGGLDDRQLLARRRLQGHLGARGRRAPTTAPSRACPTRSRRRCRTCATAAGPGRRSSNSSSRTRRREPCSRGSPTSCTGSAATSSRAEHTARMLDGVFQASSRAPPPTPRRASCSAGASCSRCSAGSRRGAGPRDARGGAAAADARPRGARRRCAPRSSARARARAPCATSSAPRCGRRSTRRR